MTYSDLLDIFKNTYPFMKVTNYRPVCHELFEDGKEGCTIWLDNGDMVVYYPNQERGDAVNEMMTFPDTWEEYEKLYGFNDVEEIYTNNSRLIPSYRVKQWLDHMLSEQPELSNNSPKLDNEIGECNDCIKHGGDWECDRVHCHKGDAISRQDAIDEIDEWIKAFRENGHKESAADACLIQDGIIQLPSSQPRKGKWKRHFDGNEWYWYCSSCKEQWYEEDLWMGGNSFPNFCPNCGCRMEEGDSE